MLTASDVHTYNACPRWTYLDFHGDRRRRQPPTDFSLKLLADSRHHQAVILESMEHFPIGFQGRDINGAVERTIAAMEKGHARISGAALATRDEAGQITRLGIADLLERVPSPSKLGRYSYEPVEIKTARRVKTPYRLQLAFYADLLSRQQGVWPERGHLILGDGHRHTFLLESIRPRYEELVPRLIEIGEGWEPAIHICGQCSSCPWQNTCQPQALEMGHLSLIYGLHRRYAGVLISHGVHTYHQLAKTTPEQIHDWIKCGHAAAERMVGQACALSENRPIWRDVPKLPRARSEIFFDIEGDPDHDALYLFGVLVRDESGERYHSFLAEKPEEEKQAFIAWLEFVESLPDAPIYHYHHYERSALSRLVQRHGVAQHRVDAIIPRLNDLNGRVTESCFLPVSSYSLKAVARYLGFEWSLEKSSAVQSVVWFSSWLKSGDRTFLNHAIEYNSDDCRATRVLKDWLAAGPEPHAHNGKAYRRNGKNRGSKPVSDPMALP